MRAKKVKGISTFFSEKTIARLRHAALKMLRQFYIKTNNQLIQKSLICNALQKTPKQKTHSKAISKAIRFAIATLLVLP